MIPVMNSKAKIKPMGQAVNAPSSPREMALLHKHNCDRENIITDVDKARKKTSLSGIVPHNIREILADPSVVWGAQKRAKAPMVVIPTTTFAEQALQIHFDFNNKIYLSPNDMKEHVSPDYKDSDVFLSDYIIAPVDMSEHNVSELLKERKLMQLITGDPGIDHFADQEQNYGVSSGGA